MALSLGLCLYSPNVLPSVCYTSPQELLGSWAATVAWEVSRSNIMVDLGKAIRYEDNEGLRNQGFVSNALGIADSGQNNRVREQKQSKIVFVFF